MHFHLPFQRQAQPCQDLGIYLEDSAAPATGTCQVKCGPVKFQDEDFAKREDIQSLQAFSTSK